MANVQNSRTEFCKRPFCEEPLGMESSALKPDICPVGNDNISLSECSDRMAEAMAARSLCLMERETQEPVERPLCPPNGERTFQVMDRPTGLPIDGANGQDYMDPANGRHSNGQYSAQERPICVPPQAFTNGNIAQPYTDLIADPSNVQSFTLSNPICSPAENVAEDTRPPRISECREPPATNMLPVETPGACSSSEGRDPGEVRCCIKRCEISPEIFEKDPCALPTPDGPLTSDYYKTTNLPFRFDNANGFSGYGCQQQPPVHPFYRTTSQDYGWFKPSMHTVPTAFFPQCQQFSKEQGVGGRYRNTSLDTAMAEELVDF